MDDDKLQEEITSEMLHGMSDRQLLLYNASGHLELKKFVRSIDKRVKTLERAWIYATGIVAGVVGVAYKKFGGNHGP
jgi:hypothetical protein